MKNASTGCRSTSSNADNAASRLAIDAAGIDCEVMKAGKFGE